MDYLNNNNIPERINDKTTIYYKNYNKYHPLKNYLFCVIIRIILGLIIYNNLLSKTVIYILSILIIIVFLTKFINNNANWKVYERTILLYSLIPYFTYKNNNDISSLLIIIDAVLGLQSRHIANNLLN